MYKEFVYHLSHDSRLRIDRNVSTVEEYSSYNSRKRFVWNNVFFVRKKQNLTQIFERFFQLNYSVGVRDGFTLFCLMICIWHANCFPDPVLRGQPCRSWIKNVWCLSSLLLHDCLERYRKVVGRDWCHMSFGITAEGMLTGYSQNPSQSLLHLRSRAVAWCLLKTRASHPEV